MLIRNYNANELPPADTVPRADGSEADRHHKISHLADKRRDGAADPPSAAIGIE